VLMEMPDHCDQNWLEEEKNCTREHEDEEDINTRSISDVPPLGVLWVKSLTTCNKINFFYQITNSMML